ncbi:hypothetical protein BGZ83_010721 [Gryganskiella cystojenkinii]|nr:hypothetical protein BGZ83_010721 [Gryganskiella cystojenkinii]
MASPPPLPKRTPSSLGSSPPTTSTMDDHEPYNLTSTPASAAAAAAVPATTPSQPPPLPKRQQPPIVVTPPVIITTTASVETDQSHSTSGPAKGATPTPPTSQPKLYLTASNLSPSSNGAGAFPTGPLSPRPESASGLTTKSAQSHQSHQNAASAHSARTKEEVSFQFDRQVQEIRRRRTVAKRAPRPDRDDFTRIESESGKRILDYRLYIQAHLMYFVESLARDDKVRKVEPLQWSKIRAMLSRLYDTSNPAQSLGLYIEAVMYWKNPPLTAAWCALYFTLWLYKLWLPGFISLFVLKMLNNRYGFFGNFKEILQIPQTGPATTTIGKDGKEQIQTPPPKRSTKMHSQLRELIHSKDLTDWISQMTKIWGPYCQALLEENINYLERLKKWERPEQTWRVVALLTFYIFVSAFFQFMVVPAVGFFIGCEFFFLLPLQRKYPRFSHVFSPVEWVLWNVPTNAELVVEILSRQQEEERRRVEHTSGSSEILYRPNGQTGPSGSAIAGALVGAGAGPAAVVTGRSSLEGMDRHGLGHLRDDQEGHHEEDEDSFVQDSASFIAGLSPASKIKYEYQKRTRRGRSGSSGSSFMDFHSSSEEPQERSEFHCLLRGKPGKLVIAEESLLFRSSKLLGREIEYQIHWEDVDTIKKSKTMNLGIWSMPGLEVTDIDGRVMVFQNVVHRDEAFRRLVVASGKKWTNVA